MIENPINQAVTYHCKLEPPGARDSWDIIGGPGHHLVVIYPLVENRHLIQGPNQALVPGNIAPGTRET